MLCCTEVVLCCDMLSSAVVVLCLCHVLLCCGCALQWCSYAVVMIRILARMKKKGVQVHLEAQKLCGGQILTSQKITRTTYFYMVNSSKKHNLGEI